MKSKKHKATDSGAGQAHHQAHTDAQVDPKRFNRRFLSLFLILFAVVGGIFLLNSYADNPNLNGDINNDNVVNELDLSIFLREYGSASTQSDINGDGQVDAIDLSQLLKNWGQTYTPNNPAPTVTLTANPGTINAGQSSTLTWSSTNATNCNATGAWSGTRALSGSQSVSPSQTSTYTVTCTGTGGSANRSVTVTVNTPTPPPPPPTSGSVNCLVSNRTSWALAGTNCTVGSTITRTNQGFACSQPLSSYGTLPLKVVINSTTSWGGNGVTLDNGCVGDGNNDTIDLIIVVNANGQTGGIGPADDSTKFRQDPGPHDIQITGKFECGAPGPGAHPDTWQFQSSSTRNMAIVNGTTGNWSAGTATCQTAGGAMFWSDSTQVDILGGEYVGCNHGILANQSGGSLSRVIDAKFRTGRTESVSGGGDPNCQGFASSPPCLGTTYFITFQNVTCERWNSSTNTWNASSPQ